jgi:hypothetical protein
VGERRGDSFIRITGVVLQADLNAAKNNMNRGADEEITRYMKSSEVQAVLLRRTAMFLELEGKSLDSAVELGWLDSKHSQKLSQILTLCSLITLLPILLHYLTKIVLYPIEAQQ